MDDIIKKSFLEGFASTDITSISFFASIFSTAAIGLFIFFFYKTITRKTFCS